MINHHTLRKEIHLLIVSTFEKTNNAYQPSIQPSLFYVKLLYAMPYGSNMSNEAKHHFDSNSFCLLLIPRF